MASKAYLAFLSLLIASRAQPSQIKARSTNLVTDGDFSSVPQSCTFERDITCASWTVSGSPTLVSGDENGNEPGDNEASFWNDRPRDTGGTLSQEIDGLSTGQTYTLSYIYRKYFNFKPTACTFTVTIGSQTLDSIRLPPDVSGDHHKYITRTKSFTPTQSSETLTFKVSCPGTKGAYQVDLDNISIIASS